MSLGVKSLWRARSCIGLVQGLSLVPRESRNLLFKSSPPTCWLSIKSPSSTEGLQPSVLQMAEVDDKVDDAVGNEAQKRRSPLAPVNTSFKSSPTARGRAFLRYTMKMRMPGSRGTAMIKRLIQYSNRRAAYRSLRKHRVSVRRQSLHEYARETLSKPANDWQSTLDFMLRHTPKFGEILDFKVGIGKRAAAHAREALSELDMNIWQIQQRHHCKIRIESGYHENAALIFSLSGTNVSVREALLELVRVVGKVLAVRVLDPALEISSPDVWKSDNGDQHPIRILKDQECAAEDETITVYGHADANLSRMARRPKQKLYRLVTRADEIPRPAVWTKPSFEQYVAKLVLGQVPTHVHRSLYPVGLDHQATVVRLLVGLFCSEDLRAAISVTALKMALKFIHSRGPAFRPAARAIFYQVELLHLPLDAEAFQTFLISASRAGDLQGFNSVLRAMVRKGHYVRVETWTAFLAMIHDPQVKNFILRKMRSRGLYRLRPILEELGRQTVLMGFERRTNTDINIERFVRTQDRKYGRSWLDVITVNRIIDIFGAHGNLGACHDLLALVDRSGRVRPDQYTLNTMITHTRSIPQRIALLSKWPGLKPDAITYQQLFQAAWKQRLPNMLRVIWRYGVFAGLTNSKMRHTLTKLLGQESSLSKNRTFLKAWEDVILGRTELTAGQLSHPSNLGAAWLMKKYIEDAGYMKPLVRLPVKLQEAYDMDMRIHKLNKEGTEVSASMRESLTVDIPLGFGQVDECAVSDEVRSSKLKGSPDHSARTRPLRTSTSYKSE
ncbi:hypothetical protein F5Y19DRAFT_317441 [Xylariaceae sp. FL1651]|nr:hypothetical protein F5Y19DRAFT_317441 [Xylariaceae sp. FL1651]